MAAADLHSEQQRVRGAAKRDQRRALQAARLVAQERRGAERRRRRLIRYLAVALGTASLLVLYAAMDMASRGAVRTVEGGGGVFAVWYGLHDRGAQQRHGLRLDAPGASRRAVAALAEQLAACGRTHVNVFIAGRTGVGRTQLAADLAHGTQDPIVGRTAPRSEPAKWGSELASVVEYAGRFANGLSVSVWDSYALGFRQAQQQHLTERQRVRAKLARARQVKAEVQQRVKRVDVVLLVLRRDQPLTSADDEVFELLDIAFGGWVWERVVVVYTQAADFSEVRAWSAIANETSALEAALRSRIGRHRVRHPLHGVAPRYRAVSASRDGGAGDAVALVATAERWKFVLWESVLQHGVDLARYRGVGPCAHPPVALASWSVGCEVAVLPCDESVSAKSPPRSPGNEIQLPGYEAVPEGDRAVLRAFAERAPLEKVLAHYMGNGSRAYALYLRALRPAALRELSQWLLMTPCERLLVSSGSVATFGAVRALGSTRVVEEALAVAAQAGAGPLPSLRDLLAEYRAGSSVTFLAKIEGAVAANGTARSAPRVPQFLASESLRIGHAPLRSITLSVKGVSKTNETNATEALLFAAEAAAAVASFAADVDGRGQQNADAATRRAREAKAVDARQAALSHTTLQKKNSELVGWYISTEQKATFVRCVNMLQKDEAANIVHRKVEDRVTVMRSAHQALRNVLGHDVDLELARTRRETCGYAVLSPMERLVWTTGTARTSDIRTMNREAVVNTAISIVVAMSADDGDPRFGGRTVDGVQAASRAARGSGATNAVAQLEFVRMIEYYTLPARFPKDAEGASIIAARYPATCSLLSLQSNHVDRSTAWRTTGPSGKMGIRAATQMLTAREVKRIKGFLDGFRGSGRVEAMLAAYLDAKLPTGAAKSGAMVHAARYLLMTPLERVLVDAGRDPRVAGRLKDESLVNTALVELEAATEQSLAWLQKAHQDFEEHGSLALIKFAEVHVAKRWMLKHGITIKETPTTDWLRELDRGWAWWWCGAKTK
jgi:predicted GTPase